MNRIARTVAPGLRRVLRFAAMCRAAHSKCSVVGGGSDFVKKYSREFKKEIRDISPSARPALQAYDWPGNVRELENIIERSVALATRPIIRLEDLPLDLAMHEVGQARGVAEPSPLPLKEARERFEQAYVLRA